MQREVIRWLQGLCLSTPVHNPRRDMANGVAAAEIVSVYCERCRAARLPRETPEEDSAEGSETVILVNPRVINLSATAAAAKRDNWNEVLRVLSLLRCKTVTAALAEAVIHRHPNAAQAVLENLYEFFTERKLAMRSVNTLVILPGSNSATTEGSSDRKATAKQPTGAIAAAGIVEGQYLASRGELKEAAALLQMTGAVNASTDLAGAEKPAKSQNASLRRFMADQEQLTAMEVERGSYPYRQGGGARGGVANDGTQLADEEALLEMQDALVPSAAAEVQQVLALTRNEELAIGPKSLSQQKNAHYSRPTASSLVHIANNSRHTVSLDKPKYAEDELLAQRRNQQILSQHDTVEKAYFREPDPSAAVAAAAARESKGNSAVQSEPTLTAILRGPFASNASTRGDKGGKKDGKARSTGQGADKRISDKNQGERDQQDSSEEKGMSALSPTGSRVNTAAGRESVSGATSVASGPRRLQVNTMPDSLRVALAVNGVYLSGEERARQKSLQLFQDCNWQLQTAFSLVLKDVLLARKELTRLLDMSRKMSTVYRSDDVVLQDLLSCVVGNRHELTLETLAACCEALAQNVVGTAASALHRPSEYEYLMQTFGYAFTTRAARVQLLHVSSAPDSVAIGKEPVSKENGVPDSEVLMAPRRSQRSRSQSISHVLLSTARRRPSYAASLHQHLGDDNSTRGSCSRQTPLSQQAVFKDDVALDLGRVFLFLCSIGKALQKESQDDGNFSQDAVPAQIMERFFLPAVQRFILSTGTPAMVEAAARVMVSTLYANSDEKCSVPLRFLDVNVQPALRKQLSAEPVERWQERYALIGYHMLSQLLQRQRTERADLVSKIGVDGDQDGDAVQRALAAVDASTAAVADRALRFALDYHESPSPAVHIFAAAFLLLAAPTASLATPTTSAANESQDVGDAAESAPVNFLGAVSALSKEQLQSNGTIVSWEERVLTLELLLIVADRLFTSVQDVEDVEEKDRRRQFLGKLEDAVIACLDTFARDNNEVELQLALSVVGRHLMSDVYPRLSTRWLDLLLVLPDEAFHNCLLPHETQPLHLNIARAEHGAQLPQPSATSSSIRVLLGAVESSYVVAPLNQCWNTSGVVHLVLRNTTNMSRAAVLAFAAAALISPQPISTQEKELSRNLQMTVGDGSDADRSEERTKQEGDEEGGEQDALTFTLRDVVGGDTNDEAGKTMESAEDVATSAATGTAAFWRGAMRYLAPILRAALLSSDGASSVAEAEEEEEEEDEEESADKSNERETATAVLFTIFWKCAYPEEVAAVNEDREEGLDAAQSLLAWAATFESH